MHPPHMSRSAWWPGLLGLGLLWGREGSLLRGAGAGLEMRYSDP